MADVKNELGDTYTVDEDGYLIDGVLIRVGLNEIIDRDLEGFLDLISDDAGFPLISDLIYELEGNEYNDLLIRVRGNVSHCVEEE